jgi:dienelactone hydrolase
VQGIADQLQQALERALVPHDVKEYPEAGHSFMNHHRGYSFLKILRVKSIVYNDTATLRTHFARLHSILYLASTPKRQES